jgi:predicted phosphoribosyltransferase
MMFPDRVAAGKRLAQALAAYQGKAVVVYALPRGGVVLGVEIARFLNSPLDLLVVRKIGHPVESEYAIGAVAEDGYVVANPDELAAVDKGWFDAAADAELKEAQRRRRVFLQGRKPVDAKGKIAIIVDDGLATGLTMLAAIHEIRKRGPGKVVVAVPVAASDTVSELRSLVDDVVVLHIPQWMGAIGAFYEKFDQVSDDEVVTLMKVGASAQAS